mmetsp:Transcript_32957/g.102175  ORF Transcript_32957/g.102175 Transcript_32957/m.102175 type:complete len:224 (+) Transcript_32957:622-1293(+)
MRRGDRQRTRLRGPDAGAGDEDPGLEHLAVELPELLADLRVPLRRDDEEAVRRRLQQVGDGQRPEGPARVRHDQHERVLQVPAVVRQRVARLGDREVLAPQAQQLVRRDAPDRQPREARGQVRGELFSEPQRDFASRDDQVHRRRRELALRAARQSRPELPRQVVRRQPIQAVARAPVVSQTSADAREVAQVPRDLVRTGSGQRPDQRVPVQSHQAPPQRPRA